MEIQAVEHGEYSDEMLCRNYQEYVERMKQILNELQQKSLEISGEASESAAVSPVKVSTTPPASKVIDCMLMHDIGSVIVVEDHSPRARRTDRDLLERADKAHRDPDTTYAKEIMSTPHITIDAGKPLMEALKTMRDQGIRRLVVTKEGKLAGILTERRALRKIVVGRS